MTLQVMLKNTLCTNVLLVHNNLSAFDDIIWYRCWSLGRVEVKSWRKKCHKCLLTAIIMTEILLVNASLVLWRLDEPNKKM